MDHCDGDRLIACGQSSPIDCPLTCVPTNEGARCATFDPLGPATPEDLQAQEGIGALETDNVYIDTDTGQIRTSLGGDTIRAANVDPSVEEIVSGLGFRHAVAAQGEVAILRASSVHAKTLYGRGTRPLVLVASESIEVRGEWRILCGTWGARSNPRNDGSGGGNAGRGGRSRYYDNVANKSKDGAEAPAPSRPTPFDRLVGGEAGASMQAGAASGLGAPGGGAIQLVAGKQIRIGNGAVPAGIFAYGCNGGAGGGAGGAILVEAPSLVLPANGTLTALGAGGNAVGLIPNEGGSGGSGGGSATLDGGNGSLPSSVSASGAFAAGGGGAGYLSLRNKDGIFDAHQIFTAVPRIADGFSIEALPPL